MVRRCNQCGRPGLADSDFHPTRRTVCRKCLADNQRAYRKTRPVEYWREKNRKYTIKKHYGLSMAAYDEMESRQEGRCAICGERPGDQPHTYLKARRLHIDHDHKTGAIRELLCNGCNRALGFLGDRAEVALRAAVYLEKHCGRAA